MGHFKDATRQCCLDIMQGNLLNQSEVEDVSSGLQKINDITNEIVPVNHQISIPHLALGPEFQLFNALYYMSRQVVVIYYTFM